MRGGVYKIIRRHPVGKGDSSVITVPAHIARAIPDTTRFVCEVTPDGILYRALAAGDTDGRTGAPTIEPPVWVSA
jgi:hypothetical protein